METEFYVGLLIDGFAKCFILVAAIVRLAKSRFLGNTNSFVAVIVGLKF